MNIEERRSLLLRKRGILDSEIMSIRDEVSILLALIEKAEKEIESIDSKLSELEGIEKVKYAQVVSNYWT